MSTPQIPPLVLTRRELLWLGCGSVGVGSALFLKAVLPQSAANSVSRPLPIPPPLPTPSPPAPTQPVPSKAKPALSTFHFEVVTVNVKGQASSRKQGQAQSFTEDLDHEVGLEMVSLPGGRFFMGSPAIETRYEDFKLPQHPVTVKPLLLHSGAVASRSSLTEACV